MRAMASQITGFSIVYSFVCSGKKTSKLCVTGLCDGNSPEPVNSPHKGPVTRKKCTWWRHHDIGCPIVGVPAAGTLNSYIWLWTCTAFNTARYRYLVVSFLQRTQKRHPLLARKGEVWDVFNDFVIWTRFELFYLWYCVWYRVIFDRDTATVNTTHLEIEHPFLKWVPFTYILSHEDLLAFL